MKIFTNKIMKIYGSPELSLWDTAEINSYTDYYEHLECSCFDVVMCEFKGHTLSVYCDDEGMLKRGNIGRTVANYQQPIFGNICVTGGVDDEGETLPIPDELSIKDMVNFIGEERWIIK